MKFSQTRVAARPLVVVALLLVGVLTSACNGPGASPDAIAFGPTPLSVVPASPAPVVGPPFTIQIASTGTVPTFTDASWGTLFEIVMDRAQISPSRPTGVTINCGTGAAVQRLPGVSGLMTCTFATPGTFQVTATASGADGFTASDATTVTAIARPVAPPPPPPPAQAPPPPPALHASLWCTTNTTLTIACNVSALRYGSTSLPSEAITRVQWDWGEGNAGHGDSPVASHTYAQTGTYSLMVTVTARTADGDKTTTVSSIETVPKKTTTTP